MIIDVLQPPEIDQFNSGIDLGNSKVAYYFKRFFNSEILFP